MNQPLIRRLDPADAPAFQQFRQYCIAQAPQSLDITKDEEANPHAYYQNILRTNTVYAAMAQGQMIATSAAECPPDVNHQHSAYIWGLFVRPEYRQQGLARSLLATTLADLPERVEIIRTDIMLPNDGMEKLVQAFGFARAFTIASAWKQGSRYIDCAVYTLDRR